MSETAVAAVSPLGELARHIEGSMPGAVDGFRVAFGDLTLETRADQLVALLTFLRSDPRCLFQTLIDICGVDHPDREPRFDVVYHLLSMRKNQRIRLKVRVADGQAVPSVVKLFPCADWFEREAFDMYGLLFEDHPDLRRILTDYGFQGFPLRKDFPLTGYVEVRYDPDQERVVYEPVKLAQAYRSFDFLSPWEGLQNVLPGDEKATG